MRPGVTWAPSTSCQLAHLRFRLLQPESHVHPAVHRGRRAEMLLRLLSVACAPVELGEAEVTVGDEGTHAPRLGEGQRLVIVGLAALGIEPVGMGRDVAEQVQRMGRIPKVTRREFDGAVTQALRLVEPAEPQTGATQRAVGPADIVNDSPRRVTLN